jgi:hypothetical protein
MFESQGDLTKDKVGEKNVYCCVNTFYSGSTTIVESGIKHQKHNPNPIQEVVQLIFVSVLVTINNTNL